MSREKRLTRFVLSLSLAGLVSLVSASYATGLAGAVMGEEGAAAITLTLELPPYQIVRDEAGLDVLQVEGFELVGQAGQPWLPHKVYNVAVPPEAELASLRLEVLETDLTQLPGTYRVKPASPDLTGTGLVASSDTQAPDSASEDFASLLPYGQMRKWRFARVNYVPFRYDPASGELSVASKVTVRIGYDVPGERRAAQDTSLLQDTVMDDVAQKTLVNYDTAKAWYQPPDELRAPGDASQANGYVIITTNQIEAASTMLETFVTHKNGRGFNTLVITEDNYGVLNGPAPNGKAEKIRQWLLQFHDDHHIKYVLLIGNPNPDDPANPSDWEGDVPMKMVWPRRNVPDLEDLEAPTDYFYADLSGDWDLDGDGYHGEWDDDWEAGGVDLTPEVYVGRIPVYVSQAGWADKLDDILRKIVDYESEPDPASWRKSALLPMSFGGVDYDGAPLAAQMKDDYLDEAGFTSWTQYQQGGGKCGLNSSYASDQELRGGTLVRDRWSANDYGLVVWWGHGNSAAVAVGCGRECEEGDNDCDPDCWDGDLFNNTQTGYLDDNHPAFVFQNSCLNGYPEEVNNLQYALLKRGAIATVSASRVSWFNTGVGYGGFDGSSTNSGLAYEYARRLVEDNLPAGDALYETKAAVSGGWTERSRLMNFYVFNLYGDPSVPLLTTPPRSITGYVRDRQADGIEGVTVGFGGARPAVTTNSHGYYYQSSFSPGSHIVTFERAGYTFSPMLDALTVGDGVVQHDAIADHLPPAASLPYSDNFESSELGEHWSLETDFEGRVRIGTGYAHSGSRSLLLDDDINAGAYSQASAILALDLSGQTQVELSFWWRAFSDEPHIDGVQLSNNGSNWASIFSFDGDQSTWARTVIDLDAAAANVGMSLNEHVYVKFIFFDDWSIPSDGYAIDDVVVRDPRPQISGRVRTPWGNDIEGVSVDFGGVRPSVTTGSDGRYVQGTFPGGDVTVRLSHPGYFFVPAVDEYTLAFGGEDVIHNVKAYPLPSPASLPFSENFAISDLSSAWALETDYEGQVRVSGSYAYEAPNSLTLDTASSVGRMSHAAAILGLDLADVPHPILSFWWRGFYNESHADDGVFISDDDGASWQRIFAFSTGSVAWTQVVLNLSLEATAAGVELNDHFLVKFQFYDNCPILDDGYAIDKIEVYDLPSHTIQGYVRTDLGYDIEGVTVDFGGQRPAVTTDSFGHYVQSGFLDGDYVVSFSRPEYAFAPKQTRVTVNGADASCDTTGKAFNYSTSSAFFDFEDDSLGFRWALETDYQGRAQLSSAYSHGGSTSLLLDDQASGGGSSHAAAILALDRSGGSAPSRLSFWWREFGDEDDPDDGVFLSSDGGLTWHRIFSFNGGSSTWTHTLFDLAAEASAAGLSGTHLLIKFQFYDDYPSPQDGYAIDDVRLYVPYRISGYVRDQWGEGIQGVSVGFGADLPPVTTDNGGYYLQDDFWNGTYSVTFSRQGFSFSPWQDQVQILVGNASHNATGYSLAPTGLPFSEGFESGELGLPWALESDLDGRIRVESSYAHSGTYSLLLDTSSYDSPMSHAAAVLPLDLSSEGQVGLSFWWREFGDEDHPDDGVFISDDYGATWQPVYSFNGGSSNWTQAVIDLAAAAAGMDLNDHFLVKFQFYDDDSIMGDGYAIDDVAVYPVPYSIQGHARTAAGVGIAGVAVSFGTQPTVTTNASGYYTQTGFLGSTTVRFSRAGFVFSPAEARVWTPDPAAVHDTTGTPLVPTTLPFSDGFEAGSLSGSPWAVETDYDGRVQLSSSSPQAGAYCLRLDDDLSNAYPSHAAVVLPLDLSGAYQVALNFWWRALRGSTWQADSGVFISDDDGASWHKIYAFQAGEMDWTHAAIDLDAKVLLARLAFNDRFLVKFQFYGNRGFVDAGGYVIDNVEVYDPTIYTPYGISGHVRDQAGQGIAGAVVDFGTGLTATTDSFGYYAESGFPNGAYTLTFSHPLYAFSPTRDGLIVDNIATSYDVTGTGFIPASLPFRDRFETGALGEHWAVETEFGGRAKVQSAYAPYEGTYGLLLDNSQAVYPESHIAAAILSLDLSREASARLYFWWREYSDADSADDGVFISDDYGASWHKVFSFTGSVSTFTYAAIDLRAEADAAGMGLNDHFLVKFQTSSHIYAPYNGRAFDDVNVQRFDLSGVLRGSVTSDRPGGALAGVTVEVADASKTVITGTSDSAGSFGPLWMISGTYTVTLSAPGYLSNVRSVDVGSGLTTTRNARLTLNAPQVSLAPSAYDETLAWGVNARRTLTVTNDGKVALDYTLSGPAWLSINPASGSVPASGSGAVSLGFNGSQLSQPGSYADVLRLASNDPFNPSLDVPLTLTVRPASDMGWLRGTLMADRGGGPVIGALVELGSDAGVLVSGTSALGGVYGPWWVTSGTYTVTVSAGGHVSASQPVSISRGVTTTQDFTLWQDIPRVTIPIGDWSYDEAIKWGKLVTRILTITNDGPAPLHFSIVEVPDAPWLSEDPASGVVAAYSMARITLSFDGSKAPLLGVRQAIATTAGTYTTTLQVSGDDPYNPLIEVPVSVSVAPPAPELSLSKRANTKTVAAGSLLTYTLTLENVGTASASSLVITDALPAHTAFAWASAGGRLEDGEARWSGLAISAGHSLSVSLAVTVTSPLTDGTLIRNEAYGAACAEGVRAGGEAVLVTVRSAPVLAIGKTASRDVQAGGRLSYTLTVRNTGNASATELLVTDTLPAHTVLAFAGDGGAQVGEQVQWHLPMLGGGDNLALTLAVTVTSPLTDGVIIRNEAYGAACAEGVSAAGRPLAVTVHSAPALSIAKSAAPEVVNAGQRLLYTLVVRNTGGDNATGVTVTDSLPAGTAFAFADSGGELAPGGEQVRWVSKTVPAGGELLVSLAVTVDNTLADGSLLANAGYGVTCTQGLAASGAPVTVTVRNGPVLRLAKSAAPDPVQPGERLSYTLVVHNDGNLDATGVSVSDTLPAHTAFAYASAGGQLVGSLVQWLSQTVEAGGSLELSLAITVDGTLADGALVVNENYGASCAEGVHATGSPVTTTVRSVPALSIAKTASPYAVQPGERVTYTLVVHNAGRADASGVTISDALPAQTRFAWADSGGVLTDSHVLWEGLALSAGSSLTVSLAVTVEEALAQDVLIVNDAYGVTCAEGVGALGVPVATAVRRGPVLTVAKTAVPVVSAGRLLTYTIVVRNTGLDASGVIITDVVPAHTSFASASPGGQHVGSQAQWTGQDVAGGDSLTVTFAVTVDGTLAEGTVVANEDYGTSCAEGASAAGSPALSTVWGATALRISKTSRPNPVRPGELLTYTLIVHNAGGDSVSGLEVFDAIPANTAFAFAASGGELVGEQVQWADKVIGAGESLTLTMAVSVAASLADTAVITNEVYGVRYYGRLRAVGSSVVTAVQGEDEAHRIYLPLVVRND
ncbi:MAG: DUF11 domain-containing protein [Thermoflexales bacterium]|nr:DUF11 domain-containing protein [Thermoflexales bacterium]